MKTEYYVTIKTGGKGFIGFGEFSILFQLVGTKSQSAIFNLLTPYVNLFEKRQLDSFFVSSNLDLGSPAKVRLAHENLRLGNSWLIDEVRVIYCKEPDKCYVFGVENWVEKNNRLNAVTVPRDMIEIGSANLPDSSKKK